MRALAVCLAALAASPDALAQRAAPSHTPSAPAVTEVARVNGVPILSDRLAVAVNRLIPMESFHRTVTPEKLAVFQQRALDTLIDEELQYQEGRRLGVSVSDADVAAELARSGARGPTTRAAARRTLTIRGAHDRAVTAMCQVTRAEAEQFFASNPDRFVVPEQLRVYAITIGVDPSSSSRQWTEAEERARDVLRQLKAGAPFGEMARQYSTDGGRQTGGDMGFVHRGSLSDDFEKATASLPVGQPSDVVQTLYGFHIVQVAEVKPPQPRTFADVGADLRRDLTSKRCEQVSRDWLARLRASAVIVVAPPAASGRVPGPPG